jgi:hypothetical protein
MQYSFFFFFFAKTSLLYLILLVKIQEQNYLGRNIKKFVFYITVRECKIEVLNYNVNESNSVSPRPPARPPRLPRSTTSCCLGICCNHSNLIPLLRTIKSSRRKPRWKLWDSHGYASLVSLSRANCSCLKTEKPFISPLRAMHTHICSRSFRNTVPVGKLIRPNKCCVLSLTRGAEPLLRTS